METTKTLKFNLLIAGLIVSSLGAWILIAPVEFHASYGTQLGDNPSLLSEIRAPGGALFAMGMFMLFGVFRRALAEPAALIAILTYLAYGGSRLFSLQQDGIPASGLLAATGIELVIGIACVWALMRDLRLQRAHTEPRTLGGVA